MRANAQCELIDLRGSSPARCLGVIRSTNSRLRPLSAERTDARLEPLWRRCTKYPALCSRWRERWICVLPSRHDPCLTIPGDPGP